MPQKKRILICPLDWGLGHATRCIPIIRLLQNKDAEIIIAGSGRSFMLLKNEFPAIAFMDLPGYDIQYANGSLALKLFLSTPKIFKAIKKEHRLLERIITEKNIDIVISDNRFGLWNKQVKTVFITHQLLIKAPIGERLLYRINQYYINKFNSCWIPDKGGSDNLAGALSHPYPFPSNALYIDFLSRFQSSTAPANFSIPGLKPSYDVVMILSGPEPQRTTFEHILLNQALQVPLQFLIILGLTEKEQKVQTKSNIDLVSHLNTADMHKALLSADLIVTRSGYSTIMDLAALKRKAVFVPTPGQTEQQYLAKKCKEDGIAYFENQSEFNLQRALEIGKQYRGFEGYKEMKVSDELEKQIDRLLI